MPFNLRSALSVLLLLLVAACASQPKPSARAPSAAPTVPGVKIGRPYQVFGKTYYPADDRGYDETGIASWYGPTFHSKPTANGETYNQDDVTAAHKTLPMPSWVEVQNLDNGRRLVVRINDRGPFVDGRIIDLSRRSAQLLGVDRPGLARVRVKRVYPEGDWARAAPVQPTAPPQPVAVAQGAPPAPSPVATPVPPALTPASGARYVQVAALSDEGRAQALASVMADFGPAAATPSGTGLWRVRVGPVPAERAQMVLWDIRTAGYTEALLLP